jgi:prepilin-type N-terminal cleavage/methylation domain-containing protein
MKKGFTLIEVVIAIAIIAMLVLAISSLNLTNAKTNRTTANREDSFSIAKAVCEKYKSEKYIVDNRKVMIYVNNLEELNQVFNSYSGSAAQVVNKGPEITDTSYNSIKSGNISNKKYAVLMQGSKGELNAIKVTVFSMDSYRTSITQKETK